MNAQPATRTSAPAVSRAPLIALLLVQVAIGYEWFMSGLTKIVRGDFPSGLGSELTAKSSGAAHWYRAFLDGAVIPNSALFGYLIEIGELVIGIALVAAALVWLLRWEQLPLGGRLSVLATTVLAAFGGIFMAVNFHLANGAPHPWLVPKSGFDEGVDLDSLLPMVQLVLIGVSVAYWRSLRARQPLTLRLRARFGSRQLPLQKGV
jgi:hypothetical protein